MNTEVDRPYLLECLKRCKSLFALEFLGEVLRVQSLCKLPHTLDDDFMVSCRSAYVERLNYLRTENDGLRQQPERGLVQKRQGYRGKQPAPVPGELRDRGQGILDLKLDQEGEVGDDVYELEL